MSDHNNTFEELTHLTSNAHIFNNTCSSQILRASLSSPSLNYVISIMHNQIKSLFRKKTQQKSKKWAILLNFQRVNVFFLFCINFCFLQGDSNLLFVGGNEFLTSERINHDDDSSSVELMDKNSLDDVFFPSQMNFFKKVSIVKSRNPEKMFFYLFSKNIEKDNKNLEKKVHNTITNTEKKKEK